MIGGYLMSKCKNCHVTIDDHMDTCPLCWHRMKDSSSDKQKLYPSYSYDPPIKRQLQQYKIFLFISICVSSLVLLINFLTWQGKFWSIFVVAGIVYVWLLVVHTILQRRHVGLKILVQLIAISAIMIMIDKLAGWHKWSTNYVIPFLIMGSAISINIAVSTTEMRWPDYSIYQIIIMVVGLIPLVIYLLGGATVLWPNVAAGFVSFVIFIALIIFKDKKFKQELKKRFHA